MRQQFKIVCRGSKLSLAQADIVKQKIAKVNSQLIIEIVIKETQGDIYQSIPLQELEGKDFFTKDIQNALLTGEADFAVHSLKDVSGENFFVGNKFAIVERDDPRDVALFNTNVLDKLSWGNTLVIGTSSPRRAFMAQEFLLNALPTLNHHKVKIDVASTRGNVDTRLQKLTAGEYDGIILACAGLNRLLRYHKVYMKKLLSDKRLMILPLLQCPPAPGQGAIVVETSAENTEAINILVGLNDSVLARAVDLERKVAHRFGSGCHQQFGAVYINTNENEFVHAAGKDSHGNEFIERYPEIQKPFANEEVNEGGEQHYSFFEQQKIQLVTQEEVITNSHERVWTSKTDTWLSLAKKGIWVEGSLEGFGFKFIEQTLKSPLVNIKSSLSI